MDAAVQRAKEPQPGAAPGAAKDPLEAYGWFPCLLSLDIPVSRFTVGDLLRLRVGSIVETSSHHGVGMSAKRRNQTAALIVPYTSETATDLPLRVVPEATAINVESSGTDQSSKKSKQAKTLKKKRSTVKN